MIEIWKCFSYINDFKLYSKWTGEINKAIAYRKLKNHPLIASLYKGPYFAQGLLFAYQGPTDGTVVLSTFSTLQENFGWLVLRPYPKSVV